MKQMVRICIASSMLFFGVFGAQAGSNFGLLANTIKEDASKACKTAATQKECAAKIVNLVRPSRVLLDGKPAGTAVTVGVDGTVVLSTDGAASFVRIEWDVPFAPDVKVIGGMWERTYGDSAWRRVDDKTAPRKGTMPWYFLAQVQDRTDGYGVMVQPNAFACWTVSEKGLALSLDVRAGLAPVRPRGRRIELCTLVSRQGRPGETAFAAGQAFCRMMCPSPRLPKNQVYGYNDWYCAYGRNTATNFLADVAFIVSLLDRDGKVANRPFAVVDDGWQLKKRRGDPIGPDGQWCKNNPRWGMAMNEFAAKIKALDARPGLWYRPFHPEIGEKGLPVDPTDPVWERNLRRDLSRFRAWGFEIVKIDFITWDWGQTWGFELEDSPCGPKACAWKDDAHTGAETVKRLYRAMREAAGDMYIIGCNAIDHFAAGLFELQRIGDDTDGNGWARTRKMGPNTIGMRAIQNRTFYLADGDCVGLVKEGSVPWEKNSQWLDLVAKSGTSLFISWKRDLATDPTVADALSNALKTASQERGTGEPLDWMETPRPTRWLFDGCGSMTYDWD